MFERDHVSCRIFNAHHWIESIFGCGPTIFVAAASCKNCEGLKLFMLGGDACGRIASLFLLHVLVLGGFRATICSRRAEYLHSTVFKPEAAPSKLMNQELRLGVAVGVPYCFSSPALKEAVYLRRCSFDPSPKLTKFVFRPSALLTGLRHHPNRRPANLTAQVTKFEARGLNLWGGHGTLFQGPYFIFLSRDSLWCCVISYDTCDI